MPFQIYLVLHFLGLSTTLLALGGASFATYLEGSKPLKIKKIIGMMHGIGVLIMLIGGFGMLARLGIISTFPTWVCIKLILWVILGGWIAVVYKLAPKHPVFAALFPVVLVMVAAYVAYMKV